MSVPYMPIPYGLENFRFLRRDGFYYIDKTRFVRELEKVRFALFVRPRRFGKTLWLTMLDATVDQPEARSGVPARRRPLHSAVCADRRTRPLHQHDPLPAGAEAYEAFIRRDGLCRNFFRTLKAGAAQTGAIERLFVTGVSPVNFLSLLHYFGLLSIRGDAEGRPRLGIPNQTVKRLMHDILRDAEALEVGG